MFQPLFVAATGLETFEQEITDITNNISNARTVGFKKGRTEKEALFSVEKTFPQALTDASARLEDRTAPNVRLGGGVRIASTPHDFSQGSIEITNNPFDFAIQGEGFFQLRLPDGTPAYTRAGNFHVDSEGNLVDPNGHFLDPSLTLPEGTTGVVVRTDGTILVSVNNEREQREVGQLSLARFVNPSGLVPIGRNLFKASPASGDPIAGTAGQEGFGSVNQFSIEQSNVDVIQELVRMVLVQRVFETVGNAIRAYDGMLASLDRIRA